MKRSIAVMVLGILLLSGCTQQTDVMEPTAEETVKVNPQTQALEAATQAGLLSEDTTVGLSEQEALQQVAGAVDETRYDVEATEETLSVGADAASAREYYVFVVSDTTGRTVGKVAVDRETGEKYNYLGDGVLDDYATFPLYDAEAEQHKGWPGSYVSPAGVTLTITQEEETGIAYCFSDGTEGTAAVNGETAKSADEQMNFLLADGIVTVAGGGLTGNYIAQ
ncbi:hypothetical protein [Agathobaculum sp. Marseille-P7918]|uniref:hypothetical protein n=1 Tax=Agathobaculum sp. Marseille-P7918 TaxID=2479843 RepID=UPI00356B3B24